MPTGCRDRPAEEPQKATRRVGGGGLPGAELMRPAEEAGQEAPASSGRLQAQRLGENLEAMGHFLAGTGKAACPCVHVPKWGPVSAVQPWAWPAPLMSAPFRAQLSCPGGAPAGKAGPSTSSLPEPGDIHPAPLRSPPRWELRSPGPGADQGAEVPLARRLDFKSAHSLEAKRGGQGSVLCVLSLSSKQHWVPERCKATSHATASSSGALGRKDAVRASPVEVADPAPQDVLRKRTTHRASGAGAAVGGGQGRCRGAGGMKRDLAPLGLQVLR